MSSDIASADELEAEIESCRYADGTHSGPIDNVSPALLLELIAEARAAARLREECARWVARIKDLEARAEAAVNGLLGRKA